MKISTKGRYGLRALLDLFIHCGDGKVTLAQIGSRQDLSVKYLEGIFSVLKKAGIVSGHAGTGGGYTPLCVPESITVKMVLELLESDISITDRIEKNQNFPLRTFLNKNVWDVIDSRVLELLETTTLLDLMDEFQNQRNAQTSSSL